MTLEPLKALIDKEVYEDILSNNAYKEIIILFEEWLSYSTNLFGRCMTAVGSDITATPVFLNYRNMIELLDSIYILASNAITAPSGVLLRNMFEALLNIEYLLEKDSTYNERSMAFIYFSRSENKKTLKIMNECSNGKYGETMVKVAHDLSLKIDLVEENKSVDSSLDKPYLKEVRDEALKNTKIKNWYSLFGGPNNLRELAEYLNREDMYVILYRQWSIQAHSQDISRHLKTTDDEVVFRKLRIPEEISSIVDFVNTFLHSAIEKIVRKYRTAEYTQFRVWFKKIVSDKPMPPIKFK